MSKESSQASRFSQFRWKLTLSYTAVTVGALLFVELILVVSAAIVLNSLVNRGVLQTELIEATMADISPTLRTLINQTPPDQQRITEWLENMGPIQGVSLPLSFDATDEMFVVDSDGKLLGVIPDDLFGDDTTNQIPNLNKFPGLSDPFQAALAGEEDFDNLYASVNPGGKIALAIPIWDEAHETILGVLVAMAPEPTFFSLLRDTLTIIGVSLVLFTLVAAIAGTAFGFLAARRPVERLNNLAEASIAWSQGDFDVFVDDKSKDELGQLSRRLNEMAQQLENLVDTKEELAVIVERNRLARDLHDSAKQQAFAAAAQVSAAKTLINSDPQAAEEHILEADQLIFELRQELTNLIQELRPPELEGKGLAAAVRDYAEDWSRQSQINAEVKIRSEKRAALDIEQAVFRIMQEALANVSRHSAAEMVEIILDYKGKALALKITDNGHGFDVEGIQPGLGLRSMRERAESLGGSLTVTSSPDAGTIVLAEVPLGAQYSMENKTHG